MPSGNITRPEGRRQCAFLCHSDANPAFRKFGPRLFYVYYATLYFMKNNYYIIFILPTGVDANSLYLYTLKAEFATQVIIRRFAENDFKPVLPHRLIKQHAWLEFLTKNEGKDIKTSQSIGQEVKFGKYSFDGLYIAPDGSLTAYEFKGKINFLFYLFKIYVMTILTV